MPGIHIPEFMNTLNIPDAASFVVFANDLLRWTPTRSFHGRSGCVPYPHDVLLHFRPARAGQQLTRLSSRLVVYAQLIGLWMDNPMSINSKTLQTFRESPPVHRHLGKGVRPIDSAEDDLVVVYTADSTFDASIANASIVGVENNEYCLLQESAPGLSPACFRATTTSTLGKVAVLPIGLAQLSSVVLLVKEGDWVEKGERDLGCVAMPPTPPSSRYFGFPPGSGQVLSLVVEEVVQARAW